MTAPSSLAPPAAEQVHVEMVDDLATATADVHREAIPLRHDGPLCGKLFRREKELAHERGVLLFQVIDRGEVLFGHQEYVQRGFGIDVFEDDEVVVFVHNVSRFTPLYDAAEHTRHG